MNVRTAMLLIRRENFVGNAVMKCLKMVTPQINQLKSRRSRVQNAAKFQIVSRNMVFLGQGVRVVELVLNIWIGRIRNVLRKLWFSGPERSLLFKLWSADKLDNQADQFKNV